QAVVVANWEHDDPAIRRATSGLIEKLNADDVAIVDRAARSPRARATLGLALVNAEPAALLARGAALLEAQGADAAARLAGVRLVQRALGDIGAPALR